MILSTSYIRLNNTFFDVPVLVCMFYAKNTSAQLMYNNLLWQKKKKKRRKLPWQTTHWLLNLLVNMTSSARRIYFTRSMLLENISKKQTTFDGPSNFLLHEGKWRKRPPIFLKVDMPATGKTRSIGLSERWTKVSTMIIFVIWLVSKWLLSNGKRKRKTKTKTQLSPAERNIEQYETWYVSLSA